MKKIVVTGASGFIGKALCERLLSEGNYVYAIVRNKEKLKDLSRFENLNVIELEMKDYNNLSSKVNDEIDTMFHFAWQDSAGPNRMNYGIQIPQIQYTCDTVMQAHEMKCKKFIFAGSISYFMHKHYLNNKENACRQTCLYGTAKNAANMFCRTICHNLNMKYNDVLFTNIFGVGDYSMRSTNVIINKLINNEKPVLVEGEYKYDWFYIDNAVEALLAVEKQGVDFKSYYIGNKEITTLKEILINVGQILNPDMELEFGGFNDTTHADYTQIDTSALYEDTNYKEKVSFKEAILRTAEWVRGLKI